MKIECLDEANNLFDEMSIKCSVKGDNISCLILFGRADVAATTKANAEGTARAASSVSKTEY